MQKAKVHMEKLPFATPQKVAVATRFILKPSRSCNGTAGCWVWTTTAGWGCVYRLEGALERKGYTQDLWEPPRRVALGLLGNPVMPQAPQQHVARQGLICLKEKNLPCHELSLFQHLWQYLYLCEKGKPVNITTAVGILAWQRIYYIKEGTVYFILTKPEHCLLPWNKLP